MAKKQKKAKVKWYAHPEKEPLAIGVDVFSPGVEVPVGTLDPKLVTRLRQNQEIIPEGLYVTYFGAHWNRTHPRAKRRAKVEDLNPDVPVPTPDAVVDEVVEIRTGLEE